MKKILSILCLIAALNLHSQEMNTCEKSLDSLTNSWVYRFPDVIPEPIFGQEKLTRDFMSNIQIEDDDFVDGYIDAEFVVGFIVSSDGEVLGARLISETPYKRVEKQLLDLIRKSKWKSGSCSGVAVDSFVEFTAIHYQKK